LKTGGKIETQEDNPMIKFFRKIRIQLLAENKVSKYLLYVIGEIALVVIGILIALQINNWNENRKTQNQLTLNLRNLIEDINDDLNYLNDEANLHEFRANCFQYILEKSKNNNVEDVLPKLSNFYWEGAYPDTVNLEFAKKCFIAIAWDINFHIQTGTIDEMKNLGMFSNIKNDALKKAINQYYGFLQRRIREDWNRDLNAEWRKFLRDNYNIILSGVGPSLENPIEFVKGDKLVSTRIQELEGPTRFRFRNVKFAINLAEEVLRLIKDELGESDANQ